MKRILVPTDFSPCAEAAFEVACAIAKQMGAALFFLHLYTDRSGSQHIPHTAKKDIALDDPAPGTVRYALKELVSKAGELGLTASPVLVYDKGNEKIEDYIKSYEIDLVVMGSHGVKGIREWVIGSNTMRVIKKAVVPVLVIKKKPALVRFSGIVFASTFASDVRSSLEHVVEFAKPWQSAIHLLYVNMINRMINNTEAVAAMKTVAGQFPDVEFTFNVSETNDAEWAISHFAHDIQSDLVAISAQDTTGSFKILGQSIAKSLTNHEELPVMVLNGTN